VLDGPRLFKRGRWWAADLRPWGGARPTLRDPRHPKGERTEFRDVARRWAEAYVERLQRATHDRQRGIPKVKTLGTAAEEYLRHRERTKEYNTAKANRTAVNHMIAAFGERRALHTITDEEIQRWFDDRARTYAPGTLHLLRINVRRFFEEIGRPVHSTIAIPKGHTDDPDALSDAEIKAVFKACIRDGDRELVATALATGARRAELWALEGQDFRKGWRSVRFARQVGWPGRSMKGLKGKRNRTALVLPDFAEDVPRGMGLLFAPTPTKDQANYRVTEILKRAGLYKPGRGPHVFRHTYGRLGMERYQWSTDMLRIFLGHANLTTTARYAHFGEEVAVKLAEERTYGRSLTFNSTK
jgi:integrase